MNSVSLIVQQLAPQSEAMARYLGANRELRQQVIAQLEEAGLLSAVARALPREFRGLLTLPRVEVGVGR